MNDSRENRLFELLADRSIFGLTADEKMELERLKKQFPEREKDFSLELTAAAIGLSYFETSEKLPSSLQTKIIANADDFFSQSEPLPNVVKFTPRTGAAESVGAPNIVETTAHRPIWQWLGWAFAAAACVALAVNLWATRYRAVPEIVNNPPVVQTPTPKLSPEAERTQTLAAAADAVKIPLANPKNAQEIMGEMVWSNSLQKGYARFDKLPANDISKETYQLWIVDETQNQKTPINGGVFDIAKSGEVIVPIDPELRVKKPLAIAVTVEKPGGVVVSAQEKVVALAKI